MPDTVNQQPDYVEDESSDVYEEDSVQTQISESSTYTDRLKHKVTMIKTKIIRYLEEIYNFIFVRIKPMPSRRRRRYQKNNPLSKLLTLLGNSRRIARFRAGMAEARFVHFLAVASLIAVIFGVLSVTAVFAWYSRDLPSPNQVVRRDGFSTKIYDRNGTLLYDVYGDENRNPVSIEQIPEDLKHAVVATEDKTFYSHEGFDLLGLARGLSRLFTQGRAQGGSTLTQQLVKNALLSSDRRVSRKVKEFVLAVQIERRFSKDEILQMYLNEIPYGGTAWGIGSASQVYFGKSVEDLTLVEAAILAGIPQRPSVYSPFGQYPDAYIERTTGVLRRMREDGYITREQEEEAVAALPDIDFATQGTNIKAPHFVFYVISELEEMYGEDFVQTGGLRVNTTLDLDIHNQAQEIVSEEIAEVEDLDIGNGAAMVMDPRNGHILAMVGSKDYFDDDGDGQVNVNLSLRQPGSTIKPVTYATAFAQGYTPATMLMDVKTEFPGGAGNPPYVPVNYDGTYRGPVQLRPALASSLNVPAVKLLALVGIEDMLQQAYDMGLVTLEPSKENLARFGLSVTLGGGEVRLIDLISSYSSFANGGRRVEPISILKVEDRNGKTVFEHRDVEGRRVLDEEVAFLINDVLSDNEARLLTFGSNSLLNTGSRDIAVKTGTTNDRRDNWAIGWSTNAITAVWVGNNDNSPMTNVASGVSGASPIWRRIMLYMWEREPGDDFTPPPGVDAVFVDAVSGYPEHDGFPSKSDYVIKGTLPSLPDPIHSKLKLCPGQDKLATVGQIDSGNYDEKEFYVFREEDPLNSDVNKWQEGIDAWVAQQTNELYRPPTEECEGGDQAIVRVNSPVHQNNYDQTEIEFDMAVIATKKVEKLEILIDDNVRESLTDRPYVTKINLDPGRYKVQGRAVLEGGQQVTSGVLEIGVGGESWEEPNPTPTPSPDTEATSSGDTDE